MSFINILYIVFQFNEEIFFFYYWYHLPFNGTIIVIWKNKTIIGTIIGTLLQPLFQRNSNSPLSFPSANLWCTSKSSSTTCLPLLSSGIIYTGWSLKRRSCFRGFNLPWKYLSFSKENVDLSSKEKDVAWRVPGKGKKEERGVSLSGDVPLEVPEVSHSWLSLVGVNWKIIKRRNFLHP